MRLIRARDLVRSPWKNGGGTTAEIAVWPPGAGLDGFDWRLSMADVASDGPFSCFPGVDRTLVLIEGDRLDLTIDGESHRLDPDHPICAFSGEAATAARLAGQPIRDFNVMTRRGRVRHEVSIGEPGRHSCGGAFVALDGPTTLWLENRHLVLARFDAMLTDPSSTTVDTDRRLLLVRLEPQQPS